MVTKVIKANDETKIGIATTTATTMTTTLPQPPNADNTKGIAEGGGENNNNNDDDDDDDDNDGENVTLEDLKKEQRHHEPDENKSETKKATIITTMTNSKTNSGTRDDAATNKTQYTPTTIVRPLPPPPPPHLLLGSNPSLASGITATQNMVALATSAFRQQHPPPPPQPMTMMMATSGRQPPLPLSAGVGMKMIRLPLPDRMALLKKPPYAPRRGTATKNKNRKAKNNNDTSTSAKASKERRPPRKKRKKSTADSETTTTAATTTSSPSSPSKKQAPSSAPSSSLIAASLSALFRTMDDSEFVRSIAVEFKRRGYSVAIRLRPLEEPSAADSAGGGGGGGGGEEDDNDGGAIRSKADDVIEGADDDRDTNTTTANTEKKIPSDKNVPLPLPNFPMYPSITSISTKKAAAWNLSYSLLRTYHAENCGALPALRDRDRGEDPNNPNEKQRQQQKYPALEKWAKTQLALWKRMKRDGKHNLSLERISKLHSLNLENSERGAQQQQHQQQQQQLSSAVDTAELGGESGGELLGGESGGKKTDGKSKQSIRSKEEEEGDQMMTNVLLMSSSLMEGRNSKKWQEKFERLKCYKEEHGHTNVPCRADSTLSKWCITQRKRCKELLKGDTKTPMTRMQFRALESIGFDIHRDRKQNRELIDRKWDEKFNELLHYREKFGNTVVVAFHHGHFNPLPASWKIPKGLSAIQLVNLWLVGSKNEHVPPLRKLSPLHMRHVDKEGKTRSRMKLVMGEIEYFARLKDVWLHDGWTSATVTKMWSTIWPLIDPYLRTQTSFKNCKTSEEKSRQGQLSWRTFHNKLTKDGHNWLPSKNVGRNTD